MWRRITFGYSSVKEQSKTKKEADRVLLFESYLSCHVCSETFSDPVSLGCNHSFCSRCLREFWEQARSKNCPICKRKSSKDPGVNFTLKELADAVTGRREAAASETGEGKKTPAVLSSKHEVEPKCDCKDGDRAVCPAWDPSLHQRHKMVPPEQAVADLKEKLNSDLKSLQDKRKKYKQVEKTYSEMIQHSKKQLLFTEKRIEAEFDELHQFLEEEEEARLAALREEEERKGKTVSREMKRIQEQISSLSDGISAVGGDLQKHKVPSLISYGSTQATARAQSSLPEPQPLSGALIDVAQHLGNLSFRVWEKMKDKVQLSPIILDPNTAPAALYLSDDLTAVRRRDTDQQLPDNPERHSRYLTVLGSEGFSSGRHSWEVQVGDHPDWSIGLAKQSVDRKGERFALPRYGIWSFCHQHGKYIDVVSLPVTVEKSLQRIRVQLDYDGGEVSFCDAEDNTHLHTHRDTFTETLFPYFSVGPAGDAETTEIRICP